MITKPIKPAQQQFEQDDNLGFTGFNYRDKLTESYFIYNAMDNTVLFTNDYELYLDNKCIGVTRTVTELDKLAKDFI